MKGLVISGKEIPKVTGKIRAIPTAGLLLNDLEKSSCVVFFDAENLIQVLPITMPNLHLLIERDVIFSAP